MLAAMLLVVAATERELSFADGAATLCCGIGPVEAATATARALAETTPTALLHIGIAGAKSLEPPALVIGSEARYVDLEDAASLVPRIVTTAPAPKLVAAAQRALPHAQLLPIATSARVGGGAIDCEVEAMEGFAVLRAAELAGVPAVEVRAVSNRVDDDRSAWRIVDALAALAEAVPRLVAELQGA
jgi:futalosine hydrolase